jgi:hypothetical protein
MARAIGPSLAKAGVSNALQDPVLELRDATGAIIASNDDLEETQKDQMTKSGLTTSDNKWIRHLFDASHRQLYDGRPWRR